MWLSLQWVWWFGDKSETFKKGNPGAAGMGNPHCVFVVNDVDSVDLHDWGSKIESHELFPQKTNVEFIK